MISLGEVCCCIRRLHPDLRGRVNPETFEKYKLALEKFIDYLHGMHDVQIQSPEDLDGFMMEYRTECELTRSQQILLVASLEFFLPHLKGKLLISRESLRGRTQQAEIHHTVPLTAECTLLFAAFHAARGQWRMGAAVVVQQCTGLRPSELLGLEVDHVHIPVNILEPITIRLGVARSTKVKREQYVLINPGENLRAHRLMRMLCKHTLVGQRLFPFSYTTYNFSFKDAERHYGLTLGTTPHSPRAGFATTAVLKGEPHKEIQTKGRWLSETSFHTYIDIASAAHIKAQICSQRLEDTAHWIEEHFWSYFPGVHEPQTSRFSGPQTSATSSRFALSGKQSPPTRSASSHEPTSETPMERRTVGGFAPNGQSINRTYNTLARAKGKGRGRLRPRGSQPGSIFD